MTLSLADIAFLRSEKARAVLSAYAESNFSQANTLNLLTELRRSLDIYEARAVLTTLRLRKQAVTKFPQHAQKMLFTADGLQQASHPLSRAYRAHAVEGSSVLDLCCGIGADSLAFATAGRRAMGLDIEPVRIALARHNAEVSGLKVGFQVADVRETLPEGDFDCIFYDPARRDERGRRIHDVESYLPPLSLVRTWNAQEMIVKLSPAVKLRQLDAYRGCLEFISVNGNLAEALFWLHRSPLPPAAVKLNADAVHRFVREHPARADITPPKAWLFEPDPAIMRAGLAQDLAIELGASMLDDTIAYLTMDVRKETPWGRYWRVLDWMPFQLKRLRRYLAERNVGQVTVKKRGFAMSPEELTARLRLRRGQESRVLVATRSQNQPIIIICEDLVFG